MRYVFLVLVALGLGCSEGTAPTPALAPDFSHYQGSDGFKDSTRTKTSSSSSTECRGHYSVAERTCSDTTGGQ